MWELRLRKVVTAQDHTARKKQVRCWIPVCLSLEPQLSLSLCCLPGQQLRAEQGRPRGSTWAQALWVRCLQTEALQTLSWYTHKDTCPWGHTAQDLVLKSTGVPAEPSHLKTGTIQWPYRRPDQGTRLWITEVGTLGSFCVLDSGSRQDPDIAFHQ